MPAIREMVGQLIERMTVVELHVQEMTMMKQQIEQLSQQIEQLSQQIEQLSQQMEERFEKMVHQETILQALSLRSIQQANNIYYLKTSAFSTK
ncbi:MbeD/MobD family mobilization/exclusion protein [Anoxybacillus flavithermus]|uniref:MbeD/MobD family mobilization/exclusion protein n=1 Tax=Anoxybacillus flavithermus TaxID=33934 RepID=UPI0002E3B9E4|nr:MbeD/MobD family mobilization/exclusion protein [Anoxybacillus flavithermus]